jgi:ATP-dependent DNA ligase
MAAESVQRLPEGNESIYELKFDGYRALSFKATTALSFVLARTRTSR